MSKWIKKLTEAYSEVNVNENKKMATAKALAKSTASSEKGKAAVTLPKAPFDIPKKADKMPIAKKDVNELNKSTLGSYIKKAHSDGPSQAKSERGLRDMGAETAADKAAKRAKNRTAGIATAADKLAKEAVNEETHETESGTAKVTATHVHFDNSGYTQKFSHNEIHKMNKGSEVRGFSKDHDSSDKHNHVYSDGDEEHHLPANAKTKVAEAMDPVNHKALKGKHKDRDDTDIDNDGDTDSSDKYLHKRRKAISKNVKDGDEVEMNPKLKKLSLIHI